MSLSGSTEKNRAQQSNAPTRDLLHALEDTANVKKIADEFLTLAKVHDTRERMKGIKPFIETHRHHLIQGFISLVRFIDFKYQQNHYHYKVVNDAIKKYQDRAAALEKSTANEDQLALNELNQRIANTQANSIQQLLGACEKMNLWHTLLTGIQAEEQMPGNTAQTLRKNLVKEITVVTGYLIKRLFTAQLPANDFYLVFQILDEKFTWFEELIEDYQKQLLSDFASIPSKDEKTLAFLAENVLIAYKNAMVFRTGFCELAKVETLKHRGLAFWNSLTPYLNQLNSINELISEFNTDVENICAMAPKTKQHRWLPVFSAINDYFKQSAPNNLSLTLLKQEAQEFREKLAHVQEDEKNGAEFIQTSVLTLLKLIAKPVPASEAKSLFSLALQVMKLMQNNPLFAEGYVGPCLKAALKKVGDELLSEVVKAPVQTTAKPLTEPASLVSVPTATNLSIVDKPLSVADANSNTHEEAHPSIQPINLLSAQMASMTLNPTETSEHDAMQAQVQQAHEKELAKSSADSKDQHLAATKKQKNRFRNERNALEKKLKEVREQALTLQKAAQANELSEKEKKHQEAMRQLRESKERKLKEELEPMQAQHQAAMALLDKEHQIKLAQEKQRLAEKEKQQIGSLKTRLAKKLAAKEAANKTELEDLAKASAQRVVTASLALKTSHQQALKEIEEEHTAKRNELMIKVRNMKRATDSYKPIKTVALPLEAAQDLLTLDNVGVEAYIRGGWVRDRLLELPPNPRSDIDVIVHCSPEKFRELFPSTYVQNPLEPRQFSHGKVDFWCSEGDDLTKESCDFTINSFICDLNGQVFDLRNYEKHLSSPFLHVCDENATKSFEADPIRMLRMLRLAPQVGKGIEEKDYDALLRCAGIMTKAKMGVYLKNIHQLFINPYALVHLEKLLQKDLLRSIFPGVVNPPLMLKQFWDCKLAQFAHSPESYDYYHVLALFLLQPLVSAHTHGYDIPKIQQCIEAFLTAYLGEKNNELEKVRKATLSILSDQPLPEYKLGLITEYDGFVRAILEEQHRQATLAIAEQQQLAALAQQQNTAQIAATPVQLAGYQRSRRNKHPKSTSSQVQKQPTRNGKF